MKFSTTLSGQSAIAETLGYPPEAGAGSGGTAYDTGAGAGSGTGGRGAGAGAGAGAGSGGGTPYDLKDDSLILHEGKPVKWAEHRASHFVPKSEHDKVLTQFTGARDVLQNYAKKLDDGFASLEAERKKLGQGGGRRQQQQEPDIADELAALPIVDGASAAKAIKALRDQGLGPIAQIVAQQQATIKQLSDQFRSLQGTAGTLAEHHQSQEFESHITEALKHVGEVKGFSGALPADNPTIRSIASDLWLSYDPKTWKLPEFHKMLNERIAGIIALVRESDTRAVAEAKEKKRTFFDPKTGRAHASGEQSYKHMNGRDIAKMSGLFDRQNAA
jgi:hypothetical protein